MKWQQALTILWTCLGLDTRNVKGSKVNHHSHHYIQHNYNKSYINLFVGVAKDKSSTPPIPSDDGPVSSSSSWEPNQWRQQLENIRTMRASRDAPVDIIGAGKLSEDATDPKVMHHVHLCTSVSFHLCFHSSPFYFSV